MKPRKKGVQRQLHPEKETPKNCPIPPRTTIGGKSINPAAQVYPLVSDKELRALADDIMRRGMQHPIVLDGEGRILDGRNRMLACKLAGVKPKYITWKGDDPWSFVRSENEHRRHLSESQRAICEVLWREGYEAWLETEEKRRRTKGRKGQAAAAQTRPRDDKRRLAPSRIPDNKTGATLPPSSNLENEKAREERKTRASIAEAAHVSPRTAQKAITLAKQDKKLAREVADGKTTLTEATRQLRRKTTVKPKLPKGKFSVVYADCPWKYGSSGLDDSYGHAERHYDSMTVTELCELPVSEHVADNAVLFLWVTSPLLSECWPVIKAWGFEYKASFIWDKEAHMYGHYNSVRHELLLVCTRGSCLPEVSTLTPSVQRIKRSRKHSEKPERFRQIIETLYPSGKKLELFGRKQVKGWTVFGDQLEPVQKGKKANKS